MELDLATGHAPFHDGPKSGRPALSAELQAWLESDPSDPVDIPGWVEPELLEEPVLWQAGSMPASEEVWWSEEWWPGETQAGETQAGETQAGGAQAGGAQAGGAGREPPALGGPVSLRLLSRLAGRVPAEVSTRGLVDGLEAWQRSIGFSTARMWVEIAELHARFTSPVTSVLDEAYRSGDLTALEEAADRFVMAERSMVAELAAAMTWSNLRARGQVEVALILTADLGATLEAVMGGRLEVRKAETIARALAREESALRRVVEGEILGDAGGCSVPQLRDRIRASLLRAAPELAQERAEHARAQRAVSFHPEPDDMVRMEAMLPVLDGIRVQAALDAAAWAQKQVPGEERNLDAIRSDFLVDTIIGVDDDVAPPGAGRESEAEPNAGPGSEQNAGSGAGSGAEHNAASGAEHNAASDAEHNAASDAEHNAASDAEQNARPGAGSGAGSGGGGGGPRRESGCSGCGSSSPSPSSASSSSASSSSASSSSAASRRARRVKQALRREVVVTVGFDTLTGESDEPGYLSRYGPISAHTARLMAWDVARDGYWRCAVTDDVHGTLLGLGRSTFTPNYQPPEYLQRFANTRDRWCDFPGCRQPAAACDFDHTIPYPHGSTCECGGGKRCRSHHRLKHETAWQVRRSDDMTLPPGSVVWTSPTGREYVTRPPSIGVPARNRPEPAPKASPVTDAWAYDPNLEELSVPADTGATADRNWKPPPF